tara:strand:- start:420 stop:794 length:375 start_codon:yes stop_codon:yes gene_type:complete
MTNTTTDKQQTLSALEAAKAHYKNKIGGELMHYYCDEWGIDIYYKSTASLSVENKIMALQQQGKTAEALVESVISKALDKDGKHLFKSTDRASFLHEVDPNVIIQLATKLNSANNDTVEDIVKN